MGKLVPWSSWDEWKAVCAGLFSSNDTHRTAAVAQVCGSAAARADKLSAPATYMYESYIATS